MDRDNFKLNFIDQYREEIQEIYIESERHQQFNYREFNHKLIDIWVAAQNDGLTEEDFQDLVSEVAPEYYDQIIFPFEERAA